MLSCITTLYDLAKLTLKFILNIVYRIILNWGNMRMSLISGLNKSQKLTRTMSRVKASVYYI